MWSYAQSLRAIAANGSLRRAMLAYLLFNLIELAAWVAILLYAYSVGGVGLTSLAAVVQLVPGGLLSPVLTGAIDRLPRRAALVTAYALVAVSSLVTAVALITGAPVALVLLASTALTISCAVARPMHYATVPRLVQSPGQLVSSNAMSSVAESIGLFIGPVVAGIGVQAAGAGTVLLGTSIAGILTLVLCLGLEVDSGVDSEDEAIEGWRAALSGVATLWRDGAALVLLLAMTIVFVFTGTIDVLGVSFADEVLGMGESGAGLLVGAVGVGGLVGGLVAGAVAHRDRLAPVISGSGAIQGVALAALAATALLLPAAAALALVGLAGAVLLVAGRTLLQRTTDERVLAKVFAVQEGLSLIGLAVGAALAPVLVEAWGARWAVVPIGLVGAAVLAAVFPLVRSLDARADLRSREIDVLGRIPFLTALPPYEMVRLARNASWLDVAAGADVVRQGEPGRLYYAIAEGEFVVAIDGRLRPGLLGPGDGFGELALLRSAPRSATVSAVTAGRLLVVNGEDFLAAVTGGADGHALADDVERRHRDRNGDPAVEP